MGQRSVLVVWTVSRRESDIGAWFVGFMGLALFLPQGYSGDRLRGKLMFPFWIQKPFL